MLRNLAMGSRLLERQLQSGSSTVSLNSWGSDLAEERDFESPGSNFNRNDQDCPLLLQPEVLCKSERYYSFSSAQPSNNNVGPSQKFPMCQLDREWSSLMLMMKERFAKLLLGEDFFGGSKGSNAALTISNAITKLSVAVFGDLPRLEALTEESRLKWHREMEWLLSPCDYIVELVPSCQSLQDGTTMEVMASKPRSDVYIGLPALQRLDSMLMEILGSFTETEFWYTESARETPTHTAVCNFRDFEVWVPVVEVPSCGLSEKTKKHLSQQKEAANHVLKAAKSINVHVLAEMEVPESYWKMLPKSGKKIMGDSPLRIVTSDHCCLETLLSSMDYPSYRSLSNIADGLESLIYVWTVKIKSRLKQGAHADDMSCRATPTWAHMNKDTALKKLEMKRKYVQRARSLLTELRNQFPGLLQTSLELSKIQHNKDVGYAVLESYSRALVNLATRIETRIAEVISADTDAVLSRLHSLNSNSNPLTSPGAPCRDQSQEPKRFSSDTHHKVVHFGGTYPREVL